MGIESISDLFNIPGDEEVKRWVSEYDRIGQAISELEKKRDYLAGLIAAARGQTPRPAVLPKKTNGALQKGTWTGALAEIAENNPEGVSYSKVRELLPPALGDTLKRNPYSKGFYGGMRRLERDEVIVRYRGHIFTPAGFKRYLDRVQRGEIQPVQGHSYKESPMSEEIKAFLGANGPSKAATLRAHLASLPQFKDSMRNSSAIYNVLKRLVEREELHHDEGAALFALYNENEPPTGKPSNGSDAGEAATSPIETQPSLRLVR